METPQPLSFQPALTETDVLENHVLYWFGVQPTPYNDHLFRSLANEREINLTVYYCSGTLSSHPWNSPLAQGYPSRQYRTTLGIDWQILLLPFRNPDALFMVAGWYHPTNQILLSLLRLLRRKYAIWTDTPNLERKRSSVLAFLRQTWLKWIFSGATHLLGTGKPGVTNLKAMGAPPEKLINFPFFLDLSAYQRVFSPYQYSSGKPLRLVSSGRILNAIKGHDVAVCALALAAQQSDTPFEYCIAGTGPDETILQNLVHSLGLETQVKLLGWMEPDSLRDLYLNADVLIHPSPVHDPFPNAVLEGMAAGLVVFGSDCSGSVVDRIQHGFNGLIHSAGNVEELAVQLVQLLNHPECITAIGIQARLEAEKWPVERGVDLIKQILHDCN